MGKIRFLWNNLLDGAGVTITPSSQEAALISGTQKLGSGVGMCYGGGSYSGTIDRQYVIIIDTAGELGAATFRWSDDGGNTFSAVLVPTSASDISLSNGITVRFVGAVGTDFVLGDRFDIKVLFARGTSKLIDRNRNTDWRSAGVGSPVTLTIDLLSAQSVQALALLDHNLTAAATITIAANSSNSWGSPAYGPTAITWASAKILLYLSQTYRYWQLSLTDAANPDGYLRMSNLFLGPYTELASNFDRGWSRGKAPYLDGQLEEMYPSAVALGMPELLTVQFRLLPTADRDTLLETIYPACFLPSTRRVRPLFINIDSGSPSLFSLYLWDGQAVPSSPYLDRWDLQVQFRELVRAVL